MACCGTGTAGRGWRSSGFTLIELLTVMAIVIILITMVSAAYLGITRGGTMTAAGRSVYMYVNLARQHAVTHRKGTFLVFDPASGGRGRFCIAEYLGNNVDSSGAFPDRFMSETSLGAAGTYDRSTVFNLDGNPLNLPGKVTSSGTKYLTTPDLTWQYGDRCVRVVHEWILLPEGLIFCGASGSSDAIILLRFNADGTTPVAPADGSCDYSDGENWVIAMKEVNGQGNCRVSVSGVGGFVSLAAVPD
ncbi:Tfp pilus assembly protein FimT/FimU [Verrucomicrobiota bacterium]